MSLRPLVAAALLGVLALTGCASTVVEGVTVAASEKADSSAPPAPDTDSASGSTYADLAPATATTELSTTGVADLPPEGIETLQLIEAGGPFPYSQDGVTFQNREGVLPSKLRGFYREYTVVTPGEDDRGARRIVGAEDGGRFYTDDHYDSFTEVVSG